MIIARVPRPAIKAVLLDIDDTLLDFGSSSRDAYARAMEETGYNLPPETFQTFRGINIRLWEAVEKGEMTKDVLHEKRWNLIFDALGLGSLDGKKFEAAFYQRLTETAFPIDGAMEILAYLASKYKLYGASNASHDQQWERLRKAGFDVYFTDVFVSRDFGVNKPAAGFYDCCFERMEPRPLPGETALIGDSLSADISGGNAYGLYTVWYNHNDLPDPTDPALVPCVKVDHLMEIRTVL
ncbi:MAG: YjjG family noncanonical pyrimidine nucleotidase [Firmicutes bacterium]|nr:YjjG family noncanonical pyrimidine nucleotidase [Bacillota bacterium]